MSKINRILSILSEVNSKLEINYDKIELSSFDGMNVWSAPAKMDNINYVFSVVSDDKEWTVNKPIVHFNMGVKTIGLKLPKNRTKEFVLNGTFNQENGDIVFTTNDFNIDKKQIKNTVETLIDYQ